MVQRPDAVRDDVVLAIVRLEQDRLGPAREQVQGRRREQGELPRRHRPVQDLVAFGQGDDQLDRGARRPAQRRIEPRKLDEQEALRQGEVFAQQPIAGEAERCLGIEGLVVGEARPADRPGVEPRQHAAICAAHQQPKRPCRQRLVETVRDPVVAGQVQRQPVERKLRDGQVAQRAQPQYQSRLRPVACRQAEAPRAEPVT